MTARSPWVRFNAMSKSPAPADRERKPDRQTPTDSWRQTKVPDGHVGMKDGNYRANVPRPEY